MPQHYPFSAVVGSDDMALALVLTTISPEVGGVLVRGEKGTAKSTTVRALASVLPPIEVVVGDRFSSAPGDTSPDGTHAVDAATETRPVRLVELPVGATEDRLLGSLHLSRALSDGVTEYEPGLLARAHRGILYVDEVNLLHDHLVDLLLDAAAMGRSTVERDGVSVVHAARFVLVGTMNPEEGELRPQLLDRFGLTVEVAAPRDPAVRAEVVRRRMAHDADPEAFSARWAEAERALTDRILAARKLVDEVALPDAALVKIAEVCAAFEVEGMRADLVTARTAVAHAAWHGRTAVTRADIRAAALLALPHRRRRNPFDAPGLDEDLLDQVLGEDGPGHDPDDPGPDGPDASDGGDPADPDGGEGPRNDDPDGPGRREDRPPGPGSRTSETQDEGRDGDQGGDQGGEQGGDQDDNRDGDAPGATPGQATVTLGSTPHATRRFVVRGTGAGDAGRRSRAVTSNGRRIGAGRAGAGGTGSVHLVETVRAAAPHQAARGRTDGRLRLAPEDLRVAVREGREANLVLFCVDASGSMAARRRMEEVKTAILSLLLDAYRRRDKVGLVAFRGGGAEVLLPPTHSADIAAARLQDLPAGGRTPLAEGLLSAAEVLRVEHLRDPRRRPLLVLVTDGRATHGPDAVRRAHEVAAGLDVASLVVDCETGRFRMGLAHHLATVLGAEHVPVGEVSSSALRTAVRGALHTPTEGAA